MEKDFDSNFKNSIVSFNEWAVRVLELYSVTKRSTVPVNYAVLR